MIIDLPKNFHYTFGEENDYASVFGGILYIHGDIYYRNMMYKLTDKLKIKKKCHYCGKYHGKGNQTLDHLYPESLGGPTISNNLVPACRRCNEEKSNMTFQQYQVFCNKDFEDGKQYYKSIQNKIEDSRIRKEYILPKEWITTISIDEIELRYTTERYNEEKYAYIAKFYHKYGFLRTPIIVDQNNILLDGNHQLSFAVDMKISNLPVICLDNCKVLK